MNHVIVGLGGTGGKVIRALRRLIFQEFRSEEPEGVPLGWLYVDSSDELMAPDDASWKTLGVSVQLPAASQLLITDANLAARLDDLGSYPGIQPWIGSREQWRDILNSIVGVTLGGQKRRLGRFLFACKADKYREQLQTQVRIVQAGGRSETTFHVLCGLAGGTGSGSLIDALAQLRELFPDAQRYRVLVYALLPDAYPPPNWDTGNYHANGYAALLELNALSAGAWQPHDVLGRKGRLALVDPFNGCYVFGNENENGLTVDVDRELPGIVAEFLYQKIVRARQVGWPTLARMENAENGDGSPETAPASRRGERARRFLTFGIKRVAIPEEEIAEFLGYGFARQALHAWRLAFRLPFSDDPTSGMVEDVDLAVHFGDSSPKGPWVARELLRLRVWPIASAEYLARRGRPRTIAELASHDLMSWEAPGDDGKLWPLRGGGTFAVNPFLVTRHIHMIRQHAIAGLGIALVPDAMLPDPGLAEGALVAVLPELVGSEVGLRVLVPAALSEIPRIRAMLELIRPFLGDLGL